MCGIAGFVTRDPRVTTLPADLAVAVECLRYRGPDDQGTWFADGIGLGHRRLSILDLSALGHQPMFSADGRLVMIFNGEIYNFGDIRKELIAKGHSFRGTGDAETVLAAFREWGDGAMDRFLGMFAFALWDTRDRVLHLYRDRLGVKPLYYGWDGRSLWFGSELKALRAFTHWSPRIDHQALGEYFQYGYISGPRSIYTQVRKLEPGCRLKLGPEGEPVVERYWPVLERTRDRLEGDDESLEVELEALMRDAFRLRLVSDVPVGMYLSGGVDSSLVTAILQGESSQPLRTFTIGFREDSHDESQWARRVADHLGTRHTEYILEVREALAIARGWGKLFDEPFGDSSGIPTLLVSRLAREEVKVVLSADGGDELFMGYSVYDDVLPRLRRFSQMPAGLKHAVAGVLGRAHVDQLDRSLAKLGAPASVRGRITRGIRRSRAILPNASVGRVYDAAVSYWLPEEVVELLGAYQNPRDLADAFAGNEHEQMGLWDLHHYLPGDVLTKVDRTTMAVSLEGREPLLDHRLVEFALRLPTHLRNGALGRKHLLKKILYRHVPRALVDRPKQGFTIPLERWLRDDLRELTHDYLASARIRKAGILDDSVVQHVVDDFYRGDRKLTTQLWFLLAFEMWREEWDRG
jgi:asparagine synthase (glutamine-hydrolysing)